MARSSAARAVLTPWLDALPIPPVLPSADHYAVSMEQSMWQFHSQLDPAPSWGYWSGDVGIGYLGPTIVAAKDQPISVTFTNHLPPDHILSTSIDWSIHSMQGLSEHPESRAVPHLHGGFTEPGSDGHPDSWISPGESSTLYYSNAQPACMLWYHDHAMGITRLNAYAGLAAAYIIRDQQDTGVGGQGLNIPKGAYEIPLVIQDKMFNPDGSMFYPTASGVPAPYPHPVWMPEFFGDTPVVNGKAYPYLDVEPRRYRLRLLNGSQARFYNLWFDKAGAALPFALIGMEQSLLPNKVVALNSIVLSPGERADLIIDFSKVALGTTLTLMNNARVPYPSGKRDKLTQIMRFRVNIPLKSKDTTLPPGKLELQPIARLSPTIGAPMREIVMRETMDPVSGVPTDVRLNGKWFTSAEQDPNDVDENPRVGTTEIWQFINLTVDAHPMHMHLVQFQVYNRQPFDAAAYMAAWDAWQAGTTGAKPVLEQYFTGAAVPPPPEEMGWKDTVKALPGQVTRIIAKFDLPPGVSAPADYVYHCHILEHEENEMMRPFVVVA